VELFQGCVVYSPETDDQGVIVRNIRNIIKISRRFKRSFATFHRVDQVCLDGLDILLRQFPVQKIDRRGSDTWPFAPSDQLDALFAGIGSLIELSGKILDSEHACRLTGNVREALIVQIYLGFSDNGRRAQLEQFVRNAFHVITMENPHIRSPMIPRKSAILRTECFRLCGESGTFFTYSLLIMKLLQCRSADVRTKCGVLESYGIDAPYAASTACSSLDAPPLPTATTSSGHDPAISPAGSGMEIQDVCGTVERNLFLHLIGTGYPRLAMTTQQALSD
jgi:hypothetical protein